MTPRSILISLATILALSAPAAAMADSGDWGHDREWHGGWGDHNEWRGREWREHEWREHERWERGGWGPHCWVESRGYYNWYGEYVYRPVQICR
jgi:hypothetical protein